MSKSLAERTTRIKPSPTLAVQAKASALKAKGIKVIGLGTGEPDYDTPEHIKDAAREALSNGFTKYTPVDGILPLKEAIANKFKQDNQLNYDLDQILVSVGGKQSCYNLCGALLNPGDEVIIPAPYWVSYPSMVLLADAKPVIVNSSFDDSYKITAEQLEAAITPKTRLVFLNSPSNPSGVSYSSGELKALGQVILKHPNIFVATDDMYEHILWTDEPFANILNSCPELYDRTIVLNGVSKAYSMTGWRIGYCGGPKPLIAAMKKIQSHSTSNPCSIAQYAAKAALEGCQDCVANMVKSFKERHDFAHEKLINMNGVRVHPSDGTFYTFPDFSRIIEQHDKFNDDVELCEYLLNEANVALVPGSAFGTPGALRLSYAASLETLDDALERVKKALFK